VDSSDIVKLYFNRWPSQELQFRYAKAVASLSRVSGYGRKILIDEKKEKERNDIEIKIEEMNFILGPYFEELESIEAKEKRLSNQIRRVKGRTKILISGKRCGSKDDIESLILLDNKLSFQRQEEKELKIYHSKELKKIKGLKKKWKKIDNNLKTYTVDVELDQIVTYFRSILIHMYAYFLKHYLGSVKMDYESFVARIINISGEVCDDGKVRKVTFMSNRSDPEAMGGIKNAITEINALEIKSMNGLTYNFFIK